MPISRPLVRRDRALRALARILADRATPGSDDYLACRRALFEAAQCVQLEADCQRAIADLVADVRRRVRHSQIYEQWATDMLDAAHSVAKTLHAFARIMLDGVTHRYVRDGEAFTLGPIALSFVPGETVFLIGGNGSGKTTLAKLITGLYAPEGGRILLDGEPVDAASRERYRHLFSAVFGDFFLFERLFGIDAASRQRAHALLNALQLSHKVAVDGAAFSTLDLSQGQRKRLALLVAYLEDRPFYVLDEWAADQDPLFRDVFYRQLLPELKARGKTVLVISHDDRYFSLGDRNVKLDYGRIVAQSGAVMSHSKVSPT
ncbi:cyclic peptide transporter (plasmid) [Burkholderia gladioli BSR3]|uniref:Cyclic peptide transporter n=1 Tax=Burkholderia gladioli (strain BSR3) TaxID=999541 RepID=F2LSU5_BURGS|nr:cyclic peptide transporter [Burkholderia gladioli BSR3]